MNNVRSIKISEYEEAWRIEDSFEVIKYLTKQNKIILGGDILGKKLQYIYDNWYYEPSESNNRTKNIIDSYNIACQYIQDYIKKNGTDYYVIIVTE